MAKILKGKCFILISALLLGFSCIQAQTLGFKLKEGAKKITIPFEVYNNLIVIPVVVNDQLPLRFVLDTGVRTTILTEKTFSDLLQLEYNKKYTIAGFGEIPLIEAYITNGVSLTLPGIRGEGHAMLVLKEDYLELRNYLGTEVHGVLGYELFSRFVIGIDYDKRLITVSTPDNFKKKGKWEAIPISIEDTKPYVYGSITYAENEEPVPLKLLIDTGASHGLILNEETAPNLYLPEKNVHTSLGRGLGGKLEGNLARLQEFSLGSKQWNDVIATFPEQGFLMDSIMGTTVDRNGSLGGDILSRMKVVFNFPKEEIYVKKGRKFKKDFTYNLSGITIRAIGSRLDQYEIVEVQPNSAGYDAGFREGDRLVAINNMATVEMPLGRVISLLNSKPKKKLTLIVTRQGEQIKRSMILESRL
jgi:hypothetical protein